jgi:hypothetical protein
MNKANLPKSFCIVAAETQTPLRTGHRFLNRSDKLQYGAHKTQTLRAMHEPAAIAQR